MASNNLIRSYKGHILQPIYKEVRNRGMDISKGDLELKIKKFTGFQKSCKEMNDEEIRLHIEGSMFYAEHLGLGIDFENDPRLDLDFERTNKNN